MKLAFVTPRYGENVLGGAENLCRQVAEYISKYPDIDIDIITTCARDYVTWENVFEAGAGEINGVNVKRFKNDYIRTESFHTLYRQILGTTPDQFESKFSEIILNLSKISEGELITWMKLQGPYSSDLLNYLKCQHHIYDFIFFFTYLYPTTYFGIQIAPDRSILVPTAHNEPPIYFTIFNKIFKLPRSIIYLTDEEKRFCEGLFNNENILTQVIGMGIEIKSSTTSNDFLPIYKRDSPSILLYAGRIDGLKGCNILFEYFIKYKHRRNTGPNLFLIGEATLKIPTRNDIIYLGYLDEVEKFDLMSAADILIQPSPNESFSITLLESLLCKTPVLVNGKCEVLKGHCMRSNAGLWYENYDEFETCLDLLLSDKKLRMKMGENGKKYVEENYSWPKIGEKYINLLKILSRHTH